MKRITVGIDIGGINSAFGVVGGDGKIIAEGGISTKDYPHYGDYPAYVEALAKGVKQLLGSLDFEYELIGIGIGAPNSSYYNGAIEQPANLWKYPSGEPVDSDDRVFNLTKDLGAYFPECDKIKMTNDANAATMGEMLFGAAKGMKDFAVITLGTGLGSGFVAGGEMIYGRAGFAGEFGHANVIRGGRECGCGNRGCLECYASATGIKRTAFELMASMRVPSPLREIPFSKLESLDIALAARDGDELALEAFRFTGEVLGRALADLITIFTPEAIIIFGGLAKSGELIFEPTRHYMDLNTIANFRGQTKLLPSGIQGGNVAIIGAAALVMNED
ncbi:MAG: ROK family protein [Rikenellaceae bacterium]